MFSPPLKKSIVFLKYALKMDLVKGAWFDLYEDLATALEVSRQTIGSLENGRYNPSIMLAFKIARYFQMSIEEIFIYEEESK